MRDLHSHILPGIDDGSNTIEESKKILEKAYAVGFVEMCLTPHYYKKYDYIADNKTKEKLLEELKNKNIDLSYGNEVFIDSDILNNIKQGKVSTINGGKYILIEFPFDIYYSLIEDYIEEILSANLIPIIAHPERYEYYQYDVNRINYFKEKGVLFQSSYGSFVGYYGKKVNKTVKKMLKENLIDIFSLDQHTDMYVLENFSKVKKKILKYISEEKFKIMSDTLIKEIINTKK
ncbi:MAG: CpsB/CapC family capsule biosynthesis tyrosine phosphatase [bacterium]